MTEEEFELISPAVMDRMLMLHRLDRDTGGKLPSNLRKELKDLAQFWWVDGRLEGLIERLTKENKE